MKLIRINNKPFAAGFTWTPPVRRVLGHKALSAIADNPAYNIAVSRASGLRGKRQYGFAAMPSDFSLYANAPALSCCLKLKPDFAGLFCFLDENDEEFWWLHFRLHNAILAYGDHVCRFYRDARDNLDFLLKMTGQKNADIFIDYPQKSEKFFAEHLSYTAFDKWVLGKGHLTQLGRVTSYSAVRSLTVAGCIFLACFGAKLAFDSYKEKAALEENRISKAQRMLRQADISKHPEKFFSPEWQTRPLATDFAGVCIKPMLETPLASNGWQMRSVSCNGRQVSVEWGHDAGADFTRPPKGASLDDMDLRTARAVSPVQTAPVSRPDGVGTDYTYLLKKDEVIGLLAEITQTTGTKLSAPVFKPAEKKTVDKQTIQAPWRSASWEITGVPDLLLDAAPEPDGISLFAMLAEIPGLSIDYITFNDGWSIGGNIHAR